MAGLSFYCCEFSSTALSDGAGIAELVSARKRGFSADAYGTARAEPLPGRFDSIAKNRDRSTEL